MNLYQCYKALRTNQHGQLVANFISNDPILNKNYQKALREYREFVDCPLTEILKTLSDQFAEDYEQELHNR